MNFKITQQNNFIRVFRIPNSFPSNFKLIDWFNPFPSYEIPKNGFVLDSESRGKLIESLTIFIRKKKYDAGYNLLCITDYGDSFIIESEMNITKKST